VATCADEGWCVGRISHHCAQLAAGGGSGRGMGVLEDDRIFLVTEIANNFDETPHITDTLTVICRL
jgi:hypothetical protein